MLLCGAEEPLGPNPQIYALEETSGELELSDFAVPGADRYSLLWVGPRDEASARLSAIVTSVARALSLPVVSCAAWLDAVDAPFVGVARKVRYLHRKDGWEIRSGEGIAVASRSVPLDALAWPPRDLGARTVLFLGGGIDLDALEEPAALPCMRRFARHGLAPSEPFLAWLVHRGAAVAYAQRDNLGRLGMIVAGAVRVPVRELETTGLIQETRRNAAAPTVWLMPP